MLFDLGSLAGSVFLNILILGVLRVLVSLVVASADKSSKKLGRKFFHACAAGLIALACIVVVILKIIGYTAKDGWAMRGFQLLGISMTGPLWLTVYLSATELFPTPIRNVSNGFVSSFARVGGMIAPLIATTVRLAHI